VRSANTGITAIIDNRGHVRGMTGLFREALLSGEVRLGSEKSLYTEYGDIFAWGCIALAIGIIVFALRKKSLPPGRD
jgi:apolipoprotein N-acyltransferase